MADKQGSILWHAFDTCHETSVGLSAKPICKDHALHIFAHCLRGVILDQYYGFFCSYIYVRV